MAVSIFMMPSGHTAQRKFDVLMKENQSMAKRYWNEIR